jgi:hypothetical protein
MVPRLAALWSPTASSDQPSPRQRTEERHGLDSLPIVRTTLLRNPKGREPTAWLYNGLLGRMPERSASR